MADYPIFFTFWGRVEKSPIAVLGTKHLLNYSRDHSVEEGLEYTKIWYGSRLFSYTDNVLTYLLWIARNMVRLRSHPLLCALAICATSHDQLTDLHHSSFPMQAMLQTEDLPAAFKA